MDSHQCGGSSVWRWYLHNYGLASGRLEHFFLKPRLLRC